MTRETDDDGAALADAPPAFDYGLFSFTSKAEVLEKAKEYWNPGKTQFWIDSGVPLVIDRREEYFIYDMSGKRLIDAHLNGGTYNLGHRNPEVVQAITMAMQHFDIGNHHFGAFSLQGVGDHAAKASCASRDQSGTVFQKQGGLCIGIHFNSP